MKGKVLVANFIFCSQQTQARKKKAHFISDK
jgi:hypothetical protein